MASSCSGNIQSLAARAPPLQSELRHEFKDYPEYHLVNRKNRRASHLCEKEIDEAFSFVYLGRKLTVKLELARHEI